MKLAITKNDVLGAILTAGALAIVAWMQQSSLKTLQSQAQESASPEVYTREVARLAPQLKLLAKIPSFGFDNLIGDWSFLQFLQYFGDWRARDVTGYSLSPDFFQVTIPRDAKFVRAYVFLSTSTTLYAGEPQVTVDLMNQGLKQLDPKIFDQAYLVWVYKAIDELLFLGDQKAAQHSYDMAADWVSLQPTDEAKQSAAYYRRVANFLRTNPNSKQAQINAWLMVLSNAVSGRGQQLAIENLRRLGLKIILTPEGTVKVEP
jgi:hypothetical protein